MGKGTVRNMLSHVVDIEPDGRVIAPGEIVKGVDLSNDHNKVLIESEALNVIEEPKSKEDSK